MCKKKLDTRYVVECLETVWFLGFASLFLFEGVCRIMRTHARGIWRFAMIARPNSCVLRVRQHIFFIF